MKTFVHAKFAFPALGLLLVLEGCQGLQLPDHPTSLDNAGFMAAWDVYRHCQAETDVDVMHADLQKLTRVATPAMRLAADPRAMAAACALSTGQAALRAERMELAAEMFRTVLQGHPQAEYAYYAEQARIGLNQAESGVQFAGHPADTTPALVQISSTPPARRNNASVSVED